MYSKFLIVQFLPAWVETRLKALKENVYFLWQIYFFTPVYSTGPSPTVSEDVQ